MGAIAQLGEHLPCKQGVESSNLLVSTKAIRSGLHAENGSMHAQTIPIDD